MLKAGVATAIVASAAPAFAQDEAASSDTIIVTGSRIARPELQASSPVAVVGAEEFKFSGATHVEEVLNELPQIVPSLTGASNNPGDGVATVDLRGLGAERTLVLVNGRRYVAYDEQQIVDLNTIPSALIERVDVVTGGRSAVYGSDAIAGVVNFVLKKDFEGVQVSGNYRLNEAGDGDTYQVDGIIGGNFADGKGNATAYVSYSKRHPIMANARSYSRTALGDGDEGLEFFGSSSIEGSRIRLGTGQPWQMFDANGNMVPYGGNSDSYNYAPQNYLQTPNERWFAGAFVNYEINEHAKVFTEFQYINSRANTWLAPTPVSSEDISIHLDSPFLSDSARAALAAFADGDGYVKANLSGRRMSESGARLQEDDRNAFRALVGLQGEIAGGWSYETYYSYARNRNIQTQTGNVSRTRFHNAVETAFDNDGNLVCRDEKARAAGCVPLNIYGPGNASQEGINYVTLGTSNLKSIESQVASFVVSNGELFDLGAGPAGIAFGAEWRKEKGSYRPDKYLADGDIIGFNAGEQTSGSYSVKELFGELVVPLLADQPFAHKFEFNGALRYADYSNAVGSAWSYSAGLMWAPIEDITFRGQYQRAVRAPTVNQLFQGNAVSYPIASDPCNDADLVADYPTLAQTCLAQGVAAEDLGSGNLQANTQIRSILAGNPDLTEEKSDTYTIGAVIQPSFLPRFSLTVDYYNIKIDDYISIPDAVTIIDACYGTEGNGFVSYDEAFCQFAPRDSAGQLDNILTTGGNLGKMKSSGVDFEVRYWANVPFGVDNEGRLDFRLSGTRLIKWSLNTIPSIAALKNECAGRFGYYCDDPMPKWRGSFRTTYSTGPFSASLAWKYVGKARDDDDSWDYIVEKVKAYSLFDLAFSYDASETLSFTAGVNNLFDKKPPLFGDNQQQSNTYPSTYDVFGRQYFFSATARF